MSNAHLQPSTVEELRTIVRESHDNGRHLRVVGNASWLEGGAPVASNATHVQLRGVSGIVEYVAGDLTLTARAGTTLSEIEEATAAHGQWCPLFPWGSDSGSLGATMATATCGPFRAALGRPRDIALGLQCVDGTGALIRAGGRVVKNVAGFDLTRLMVGSWGALGIITEVSVRLRARPAVDESWAVTVDSSRAENESRVHAFTRGPFAPLAGERLDAASVAALGLPHNARLLIRLGGNAQLVAAARQAIRSLGDAVPVDSAVWARYRALDPAPRALPGPATNGGTAGDALSHPLAQRVKRQFDPRAILNPGILGELSA